MKVSNLVLNEARKPTELEETATIEQLVMGMGEGLWKVVRFVSAIFIVLSFLVTAYKIPHTSNIAVGITLFVLSCLWFFIAYHRVRSIDLYARKLESGLFRVVECTSCGASTPVCYYKYIGIVSAVSDNGTKYSTLMPYKSTCKVEENNSRKVLVAQIIGEKRLFSFLVD